MNIDEQTEEFKLGFRLATAPDEEIRVVLAARPELLAKLIKLKAHSGLPRRA